MHEFLLLIAAGLVAGAMNAVAGGGTFVAFPAMVLVGVPSVPANASNTVGLFPGILASVFAYRKDARGFEGVSLKSLIVISLVFGFFGGLLLLLTPSPVFDEIVPWLLLVATLTFAFGQRVGVWLRQRVRIKARTLLISQAILSIYAGYFGGGVGIMTMATWSLMVDADIKQLSPTRMMTVAAGNAAAVLTFIIAGQVRWPQTLCLLVGSVFGGYVGARIARKAPAPVLRAAVIVVAVSMTTVFFYRAFAR